MTWTLHLPIDLKSKNGAELAKGARARAGIYAAARNRYARALRFVAAKVGVAPLALFPAGAMESTPVPFRRVTIARLMGKRQRPFDDDGLIAGAACFRDAMQRDRFGKNGRYIPGAGLVWDDSAKWSEWRYLQRKSDDGRPGVLVVVEDVAR